jgi:hypothetical protein
MLPESCKTVLVECSLNVGDCSLKVVKCSLKVVECSLKVAECSLKVVECSLKEQMMSYLWSGSPDYLDATQGGHLPTPNTP